MSPQFLSAALAPPQAPAAATARRPAADARSPLARAVLLLSLVLLALAPFIPAPPGRLATLATHGPLLLPLAAVALTAVALRLGVVAHAAGLAALYVGAYCLPVIGDAWPAPLAVLLAAHGLTLAAFPGARRSASFWRRGAIDRRTVSWMLAFSSAAAIALVLWRFTAAVDLGRYRVFVPASAPTWLVFAGILPYAALNAAFEEYVWRGVLWEAIERATDTRLALALTALSFGLAHYRGFPSGLVGVGLATIYGTMMGLVRRRSCGLLAPWIAHIVADVVIYTMVAAMVL